MKEKIEYLIEKECTYIEISLKNNDSFSIYMPNQNKGDVIEFVSDDTVIHLTTSSKDGCIYENFIKMDEIAFVTGIYNCPQLIRSEDNV